MLNKLFPVADFFISDDVKNEPLKHYQMRMLLSFVIVSMTSAVLSLLIIQIINEKADFSHFFILFAFIPVLFVFRLIQKLSILSWIITTTIFVGGGIEIFNTGGIFGDTLHWLVLIPIIALVLSGQKQAIFWLITLIIGVVYMSNYSIAHKEEMFAQLAAISPFEMAGSCTMVLIGVYVLTLMQYNSLNMIINQVRDKNEALETQAKILMEKEALLEKTNKELEIFAFAASHDMKEPLRMISMYTQLINKRLKNNDTSDNDEFMGYVTDGVKRMENMLDDLLYYSRLGKSADKKAVDLNDLLLIVQQNLAVKIKDSNAQIEVDKLPTLTVSKTEFIQLFQNLIANAIKFGKRDTTPHIQIKYHFSQKKSHYFEVKDNGIGIAEEYHERIFNIFERLHNHSEIKGSGIGLATCKKIVEALNGRIGIVSKLGEGTSIVFEIPEK